MLKYQELPKHNSDEWLSNTNLPGEKWRTVCEYEGVYEVSSYGRVRSFHGSKSSKNKNGKILKSSSYPGYYRHVQLFKNGHGKFECVHRLVAMAFIPNPNNYPYINHKDENKTNNIVENLEWCTALYNNNYGNVRIAQNIGQEKHGILRPVIKMDMHGNFIKRFRSIHDAARDAGIDPNNIWACCVGKYSYTHGNKYCYADN